MSDITNDFIIWFLPVAVLLVIIVPAKTAHEQQHGTHPNSSEGSSIGEVKV